MTRNLLLISAIAAVVAASATATASASTFEGRCVGSGLVRTGLPLTLLPVRTSIVFTSTGTCTGVLDGRPIDQAPYEGRSASAAGLLSCLGGQVSGDTTITITTADGAATTMRWWFDDANVLGTSAFLLRGTSGGVGWGQHQFTPDPAIAAACLRGGVGAVGNTVSLATVTPLEG